LKLETYLNVAYNSFAEEWSRFARTVHLEANLLLETRIGRNAVLFTLNENASISG
jgi:hypothetical protein